MSPIKRTLPIILFGSIRRNVTKGRKVFRLFILAFLINLIPACSSGLTNDPTALPTDMATQYAQSLILSGTTVPGTSIPSPQPLETKATFIENFQNGLYNSDGTIAACINPNLEYLFERMGTFDPNSMSQTIQANTFQDVDGSTRTVKEKLEIALESYDVDESQFIFLYIPNDIMFLPGNLYNEEIGQCLALIYISDPNTFFSLLPPGT
jgi:hypothetical protein